MRETHQVFCFLEYSISHTDLISWGRYFYKEIRGRCMKKTRCLYIIIACLLFLPAHSHAASEQTKKNPVAPLYFTQKDRISNDVHKSFIIDILSEWMVQDRYKYYVQHYSARALSSSFSGDKTKVWLIPGHDGGYTHIVKIQLRDVQIRFNDGKRINAIETLTYGIKAGYLANYSNKKEVTGSVKLISFYHKMK